MALSGTDVPRNVSNFKVHLKNANELKQKGSLAKAEARYWNIINKVNNSGDDIVSSPNLATVYNEAVHRLLDLLRWRQNYKEALALLEAVEGKFPQLATQYAIDKAMLHIYIGNTAKGIGQLEELVNADSDNAWAWSALGMAYWEVSSHSKAEQCLRTAVAIEDISNSDRANSYWLLFNYYKTRQNAKEAEEAWKLACQYDLSYTALLPKVCRMYIHMRRFDKALDLLEQERNEARRLFYKGLIEWYGGGSGGYRPLATEQFERIANRTIRGTENCPDEYAEACLYLNRPSEALDILEPQIRNEEANLWRLIMAGLAHAQRGDISHAKLFLSTALKLADNTWPRETRPGNGSQRILSAEARIAYGHLVTARDIRAELDHYFIPVSNTQKFIET